MTPSTGRLVSALTIWDTDLTVDALMVPEVDVVCGAEDSEIVAAEADQASSINNSFNPYNKVFVCLYRGISLTVKPIRFSFTV